MGSPAIVTAQLQVLPQTVLFSDVDSEQQLYTTVTVKVSQIAVAVLSQRVAFSSRLLQNAL